MPAKPPFGARPAPGAARAPLHNNDARNDDRVIARLDRGNGYLELVSAKRWNHKRQEWSTNALLLRVVTERAGNPSWVMVRREELAALIEAAGIVASGSDAR